MKVGADRVTQLAGELDHELRPTIAVIFAATVSVRFGLQSEQNDACRFRGYLITPLLGAVPGNDAEETVPIARVLNPQHPAYAP